MRAKETGAALHAFCLEVGVLSNHQNGRDTHVRLVNIYGPRRDPHKVRRARLPGASEACCTARCDHAAQQHQSGHGGMFTWQKAFPQVCRLGLACAISHAVMPRYATQMHLPSQIRLRWPTAFIQMCTAHAEPGCHHSSTCPVAHIRMTGHLTPAHPPPHPPAGAQPAAADQDYRLPGVCCRQVAEAGHGHHSTASRAPAGQHHSAGCSQAQCSLAGGSLQQQAPVV